MPIEKIRAAADYPGAADELAMRDNNTSAFNCRGIPGSASYSQHAYGRAIDINPLVNPAVSASGTLEPAWTFGGPLPCPPRARRRPSHRPFRPPRSVGLPGPARADSRTATARPGPASGGHREVGRVPAPLGADTECSGDDRSLPTAKTSPGGAPKASDPPRQRRAGATPAMPPKPRFGVRGGTEAKVSVRRGKGSRVSLFSGRCRTPPSRPPTGPA